MGMYTGLRFKAIIKKEYREDIDIILKSKNSWEDCSHELFKDYSKVSRSDYIPFGSPAYMPEVWEGEPYDEEKPWNCRATNGFDRYFNKETGLLCFQCSLKNYDSTIELFLNKVAKVIIDKTIHIEVLYEEDEVSTLYNIENNNIKELDYGIRYSEYYNELPIWGYDDSELKENNEVNVCYEDYDFSKDEEYR